MWSSISKIILKNRILWLAVVALFTAFMGYMATKTEMRYKFGGLLPETDEAAIDHAEFMQQYGQDGNVLVVGMPTDSMYVLENFKAWAQLGKDLDSIKGIDSVFSLANLYRFKLDKEAKTFQATPILDSMPATQAELDSLRSKIESYPFYHNLLYNEEGTAKAHQQSS